MEISTKSIVSLDSFLSLIKSILVLSSKSLSPSHNGAKVVNFFHPDFSTPSCRLASLGWEKGLMQFCTRKAPELEPWNYCQCLGRHKFKSIMYKNGRGFEPQDYPQRVWMACTDIHFCFTFVLMLLFYMSLPVMPKSYVGSKPPPDQPVENWLSGWDQFSSKSFWCLCPCLLRSWELTRPEISNTF